MFCQKCGCRIPASALKCPECGSERPVMEFCSGFWAELNQNTGVKTIKVNGGNSEENQDAKPHRSNKAYDNREKDERSESTMLSKDELTFIREKPVKKGHLLQIIGAVVILMLLLCSILLGDALENKKKEIIELEQNLKIAETELQRLKDSGQTAELHETNGFSWSEELSAAEEEESALDVLPETGNTIQPSVGTAAGASTQKAADLELDSSSMAGTNTGEDMYQVPEEFMEKSHIY